MINFDIDAFVALLRARCEELEANLSESESATLDENAPLALMQSFWEGSLFSVQWVLREVELRRPRDNS